MGEEYKVRSIDLEKLANHIRSNGELPELAALHLLDTIKHYRDWGGELHRQLCLVVNERDQYKAKAEKQANETQIAFRAGEEKVANRMEDVSDLKEERNRWYGKAVERVIEINRLRSVLEKIDGMDVHQPITAQEAEIRKLVAQALAVEPSSHPLDCRVEGKRIAVYVGFDELVFAAANHPAFWDGESGESVPNINITDPAKFALEVVRQLNHEGEDGSTPVTRLLDKAIEDAVGDGCEGIEY